MKDLVSKSLTNLELKVLPVISSISYTFWVVPLSTVEDAVALTRKILETKLYIFRTENWQYMSFL